MVIPKKENTKTPTSLIILYSCPAPSFVETEYNTKLCLSQLLKQQFDINPHINDAMSEPGRLALASKPDKKKKMNFADYIIDPEKPS